MKSTQKFCDKFFMHRSVSSFLGPKWHSPIDSMPFHRTQPPPNSPRNGYARIQNIMHGAVKILGA